jgi:hypothetical protein
MMEAKMRKTVKLFFVIMTVGVIFIVGVAKDKVVTSTWCPAPLRIDGTSAEWQQVPMTFEKKVQVDYAFMNDTEYLYFLYIFKDPQYLSSINQTGMTVYFNAAGKKKRDYGINFIQKRISAQEYIVMLEKQKGPLRRPKRIPRKLLRMPDQLYTEFIRIKKKKWYLKLQCLWLELQN